MVFSRNCRFGRVRNDVVLTQLLRQERKYYLWHCENEQNAIADGATVGKMQ